MDILALLCFSTFCIGLGIILIFFKDVAWDITEHGNDMAGRESKRTTAWEISSTIGGIFLILGGIAMGISALSYFG